MRTHKFLFLLLLPSVAFCQTSQTSGARTAHYLLWLDQIIMQMVTSRSDLFLRVGWEEFLLFSGFTTTLFLIKTAVSNRRHTFFDLEGAVMLLGRIFFASIFLSGYAVFHQVPMNFAHGLTELVGQGMLDPLLAKITAVTTGIEKPGITNILDIVVYLVTLAEMGIVGMILFAVNSFSYLAIGMLVVYGPIFIPLLITQNFSKWFYRWVDMIVAFSMLTPTIAIFTFVWSAFFMKFFDITIRQNISLAHFTALTGALITLIGSFMFMAFKLVAFNAELFSGAGSMGAFAAASWSSQIRNFIRTA